MPGRVWVVGTGPGDPEHLTLRARRVLEEAEAVVGYETYLRFLQPFLEGKEVRAGRMREELKRAGEALALARAGKKVALVSGGDAGIYGMAGPLLEVRGEDEVEVEVEVVPGVPALSAAAALLGAPLMHDFAAVSLSDLLTPWEEIAARLEAAARADFVLVLYNPASRRRNWQLAAAARIVGRHRSPRTPVGVVKNAFRPAQEVALTTLEELGDLSLDMNSLAVVGNSRTYVSDGRMITPRGYAVGGEAGGAAGLE